MVIIENTDRITLSLLKGYISKWREEQVTQGVSLTYPLYKVQLCYNPTEDSIVFAGTGAAVTVHLREEESNLGRGKVLYFVCPVTQRKCRTLYTDGRVFVSRYAFPHRYKVQTLTAADRFITGVANPYRDGGKMYYRGKLTPYGKRVLRYEEKVDRNIAAFCKRLESSNRRKRTHA